MPERSSTKQSHDQNQLAAGVGNEPPGDELEAVAPGIPEKNPHAAALGRLGGIKGGPARALKLSAERRSEIARKAAEARWQRKQGSDEEGEIAQ